MKLKCQYAIAGIFSIEFREEPAHSIKEKWALRHIRAFKPYSMNCSDYPDPRFVFEAGFSW
jgi:hypothetical protein